MQRASHPTGWLDDVAEAAVSGPSPIIVAISRDPAGTAETARWLQSAIPAIDARGVEDLPAGRVPERLQEEPASPGHRVFVVSDASDGDVQGLLERWRAWNSARDRIHHLLRVDSRRDSLVLLVSAVRMPEVANAAPELIDGAQVITVSPEPFAVDAGDAELVRAFSEAERSFEAQHGMTTGQLVGKLCRRESVAIPEQDLHAWEAIAQALRNLRKA